MPDELDKPEKGETILMPQNDKKALLSQLLEQVRDMDETTRTQFLESTFAESQKYGVKVLVPLAVFVGSFGRDSYNKAVSLLRKLGTPAITELVNYVRSNRVLKSEDEFTKGIRATQAIGMLEEIKPSSTSVRSALLAEVKFNKSQAVVDLAVSVLEAMIVNITDKGELLSFVRSRSETLRKAAFSRMIELYRDDIESLIDLLQNDEESVRSAAHSALIKITGKRFLFGGKTPEKWRKWYNSRKK